MGKFTKFLDWIVKVASLVITIPVTWLVAASVFTDIHNPALLFLVQAAAVLLVDALLLVNWILLNAEKDAQLEQRLLYTFTVWALYIGLTVLALQHGEGGAGLVFRGALGLALLRDTLNTILEWWRVREDKAAKGVRQDWQVQRYTRKLARMEAKRLRELESTVILRRGEVDTEVQLHYIEADGKRRLSNEQPLQMVTVTEQPGSTDIVQRIRSALNENPSMSKSALARELRISRTTLYTHLPAAQNGHKHVEVING